MTYNDLCAEVAALGFENDGGDSLVLLCAANRALRTIFTERPVIDVLELYQRRRVPSASHGKINHRGDTHDSVPYEAKAYSFKTSGEGRFRISEEGTVKNVEFSGDGVLHRGFLHGTGVLEFLGEYSYTVYDLAFFDEIYGALIEDIPALSGYNEYDLGTRVKKFLSPEGVPTDGSGRYIDGSYVEGGKMKIPEDYSGVVRLVYKRSPDVLTGDGSETILLPTGCEHLPALLTAAYVWLDDDPDKAEYYMSLYREAMSAVRYHDRKSADAAYHDVHGWA